MGESHPGDRQHHLSDQACAVLGDGVLHVEAKFELNVIDGSRDQDTNRTIVGDLSCRP